MLMPEYTTKFKKDLKIIQKRNLNINLLKDIINLICNEIPLPPKNKDHFLSGNWSEHRECHIQPDWLLIYQIENELVIFERTGTHSDLF